MHSTAQKCRFGPVIFVIAWLCLLAVAPAAFADSASVSIPVKCSGATGQYILELSAEDDAPMPGGKLGGSMLRACSGGGSTTFGPISYAAPGEYAYTLRQQPGTSTSIQYDTTVYELRVFVYYNDNNSLTAQLVANRSGCTEKVEELCFVNNRAGSPKTGDDTNLAFPAIAALAGAGTLVCAGRKNKK